MSTDKPVDDKDSAIQHDLEKQLQYREEQQEAVEEQMTAPVKGGKGKGRTGNKGRGKAKGKEKQLIRAGQTGGSYSGSAKGISAVREQAQCGSCGNPMTMSKNLNFQTVEGVKIPKNAEGEYTYKSPGAAEGKLQAVLCDDCMDKMNNPANLKTDGTSAIDIKRVIVEKEGRLRNIPISDIKSGY